MTAILSESWREWLEENITRGCSVKSMVESMVGGGFEATAALATIYAFVAGEVPDGVPYEYDPSPVSLDPVIHAYDRDIHVEWRRPQPQLILFRDVLSDDECEQVMESAGAKLNRSTTIDPESGEPKVIDNRSSEGTWYGLCENPLIERLDRRISALMNWPLENGEGLQVLRYGVDGEYRSHFDYFPPEQRATPEHVERGGQRTATLIVYLNDVEAGGETVFPDVDLAITPRRGQALYFRYFNARRQLDPLTLHAGAPVRAGEKWIMTKWMRCYRRGA